MKIFISRLINIKIVKIGFLWIFWGILVFVYIQAFQDKMHSPIFQISSLEKTPQGFTVVNSDDRKNIQTFYFAKNKAISFDKSSYIKIAAAAIHAIPHSFSLAVWVHPDSLTKSDKNPDSVIVLKGEYIYGLTFDERTSLLTGYINNGGNKVSVRAKQSAWQHVAYSYDGKTMKLYLNGEPIAKTDYIAAISVTPDDIFIGGNGIQNYKGRIADLCIFKRVLSEKEIHLMYENGRTKGFWEHDS